ncbi:MAG: tRNA (adenosine(37)-N6)-dimethylallyltransferase MiaA [Bacteroidales bacterium]|nr:tRNA (adenosine(37)-N6)-dimethylallyltransferase MiaA [Bacteroidales bacterium]
MITILGPTATGKTRVAVVLAKQIDAEIVSADSRQIYKRMDIGTGKDLKEYSIDGEVIPYHLIDIEEPGKVNTVFQYQKLAQNAIKDIQQRNKPVILCGGSGMYIEALLQGYQSTPIPSIIFGIKGDRDEVRRRITSRLKERLENGMLEEVQFLINEGVSLEQLYKYGLEYRFVMLYLTQQLDYNTMFQKLNTAIHQFSKRQMTWFRKMERAGFVIHWIDLAWNEDEKMNYIRNILYVNRLNL